MKNIFLLTKKDTPLAEDKSEIIEGMRVALQSNSSINLNCTIETADVLLLQEPFSYKDFRYIATLKNDPVFKKYAHEIFTVNFDDCATGLVKGLYTSLPKKRFDEKLHAILPYHFSPNELIRKQSSEVPEPQFLASWRGNPKSNAVRKKMIRLFKDDKNFNIQSTNSWLDHKIDEKQVYLDSMIDAKFALCPAGFAPVSFRIYEAMVLGKCPVIIAEQFVPPPGPDWDSFAIFIPERKIGSLKSILKEKEPQYKELGEKASEAYEAFFIKPKVFDYFVEQLLKLIETSEESTVEDEFKRWDSFSMHVTNNWTFAQRAIGKIKKMLPIA